MHWILFPFIRYALVLIAGIVLYRTLAEQLPVAVVWATFTALGICYLGIFFYRRAHKSTTYQGLLSRLGLAVFLPFGYLLALQHEARVDKLNISNVEGITAYCGQVASEVYFKGKTWRADLRVNRVQTEAGWQPAKGTVRLFLQADTSYNKPTHYRDEVLIVSPPQLVKGPSNPESFDYRAYLANKNIFHTHYLTTQKYRVVRKGKPSLFDPLHWGITIRSHGKRLLRDHFTDEKSLAIASALLLGVKDWIDEDLRDAYAGAGAMHILAVSGLHVGIVYTFLSYLFQLFRLKKRRILTTTIAVLILWLYALITGFSPSVVRAVLMFSFIEVAKLFRRQNITYNSIGASAFLLLLYNPNYVFEVGFQLSYLAVIGIVFLYPRWSSLWEPDSWILRRAWELSVVSVAAQLATFPLAIYYFHQFPNYFLLTNLIVLPAVAIILQAGLAFLLVGWIPYVSVFFGKLFQGSLWLMNQTVFSIENLPAAVSDELVLSSLETVLIYLSICCALGFWYTQRRVIGWAGLVLLLFTGGWHIYTIETKSQETEVVVYDLKAPNLYWRDGAAAYFWLDTTSTSLTQKDLDFSVTTHQMGNFTSTSLPVIHQKLPYGNLWIGNGKKILQLKKPVAQLPSLDLEVLILSQNAYRSPQSLPKNVKWKHLVLDKTNYRKTQRAFPEAHQIGEKGAFVHKNND